MDQRRKQNASFCAQLLVFLEPSCGSLPRWALLRICGVAAAIVVILMRHERRQRQLQLSRPISIISTSQCTPSLLEACANRPARRGLRSTHAGNPGQSFARVVRVHTGHRSVEADILSIQPASLVGAPLCIDSDLLVYISAAARVLVAVQQHCAPSYCLQHRVCIVTVGLFQLLRHRTMLASHHPYWLGLYPGTRTIG
jgi:hypothetical protein